MKKTIWDHLLLIILIVLLIIASSCQYEPYEEYEKPKPPIEERDYKRPSYFFKQNIVPPFNVVQIASRFGYSEPQYAAFDTGIAYGDFNEDGTIDISMALATGGDGTFVKHVLLLNKGNNNWEDGTYLISNPNYQVMTSRKTIVGDFNNDNKLDVVRPSGGHGYLDYAYIMLSNENGYTFNPIGEKRDFHTISSGDIDNDGDLDLFFAGTTISGAVLAINNGSGNFDTKNLFEDKWGMWTSEMIDYNKDGNIDIIVGGEYNKPNQDNDRLEGLTIFLGSGNGNYSLDNSILVYDNFEGMGVDDIAFGDFDKDGNIDIINLSWNQNNSKINIYKGLEGFKFDDVTSEWIDSNFTKSVWVWLILKDFNKNGFIELSNYPYIKERYEWNGKKFSSISG